MIRRRKPLRTLCLCAATAALLPLSSFDARGEGPKPAAQSNAMLDAMLPPCGAPELVERVEAALAAPVARATRRVSSPRALQRRLGAVPRIARAVAAARVAIESAERATLHMKRPVALQAVREALGQLQAVHARFHVAALVARAHVVEGRALLLDPAQPAEALRAFRLAYAADPTLRVDPDSVPSRTSRLLTQARAMRMAAQQPTMDELAQLAAWSGAHRLLWTALRSKGARVEVVVLTYDRDQRTLARHEHTLATQAATGTALAALIGILGRSPGQSGRRTTTTQPKKLRLPLVQGGRRDGPASSSRRGARRWYQRWWVWTVVGALAAGSAVAVSLAVAKTERNYTFKFARFAP